MRNLNPEQHDYGTRFNSDAVTQTSLFRVQQRKYIGDVCTQASLALKDLKDMLIFELIYFFKSSRTSHTSHN